MKSYISQKPLKKGEEILVAEIRAGIYLLIKEFHLSFLLEQSI